LSVTTELGCTHCYCSDVQKKCHSVHILHPTQDEVVHDTNTVSTAHQPGIYNIRSLHYTALRRFWKHQLVTAGES